MISAWIPETGEADFLSPVQADSSGTPGRSAPGAKVTAITLALKQRIVVGLEDGSVLNVATGEKVAM